MLAALLLTGAVATRAALIVDVAPVLRPVASAVPLAPTSAWASPTAALGASLSAAPTLSPAVGALPVVGAPAAAAAAPDNSAASAAESPKDAAPEFTPISAADTVDETALLKAQHKAVRDGRAGPLPDAARRVRYLLVRGFSWDSVHDYMGPNLRRLRKLGLDADFVDTDPFGTSAKNARTLRRAILASDKPVVLIGHSKGGLDSLKALELSPELQDKVVKFVAVQSPYWGSTVADWIRAKPFLYTTSLVYSRLLNPLLTLRTNPFFRHETLRELTPAARQAAAAGAQPLKPGLDVYSVVTRVDDSTAIKILLWITAGMVKLISGHHNDGIVEPERAVFPRSRYALIEHAGHLDTIADPSSWKYKVLGVRGHDPTFAADLTEAVVRWVFSARP